MSKRGHTQDGVKKWIEHCEQNCILMDGDLSDYETSPDIELRNTIFKVAACLGGLAVVSILFLIF